MTPTRATAGARKIFLIATEESGDRLGASLMKVLRQRLGDAVQFEGVGGRAMAREGLASLFPIEELSIIGLAAVVKQLPMILRRIKETAEAVTQAEPDILVIIDSPDFTHRVAGACAPGIPRFRSSIMSRPRSGRGGRAGRGRCCAYVDHVLALLPFEPEAYRRLRGPPCSYVGHPLTEQIASAAARTPTSSSARERGAAGAAGAAGQPPQRDPPPHGGVRRRRWRCCRTQGVAFELVLPTMPHLLEAVVEGGEELAGAAPDRDRRAGEARGVPDRARGARQVRHRDAGAGAGRRADGDGLPHRRGRGLDLAAGDQGQSVILANLVIGENVVPEFLQEDCTPENLAPALREVLERFECGGGSSRRLRRSIAIMSTGNQPPSVRAADIVLATMRKARRSVSRRTSKAYVTHRR